METVNDITREVRDLGATADGGIIAICAERLADRLDAAYKRDCQKLREENARLKAALNPVLDIVMDRATSDLSMELAIMESKRIYNDGGAK